MTCTSARGRCGFSGESHTPKTSHINTAIWGWALVLSVSLCHVVPTGAESPRQLQLSYTLTEQRDPVSTVVARLLDEQLIRDVVGDISNKHFQFISDIPRFFKLDTGTGVLTVAEPVDRDVLCPNLLQCQIKFSLTLQPVTPVTLITVTINILDINDHSPEFEETHITKSIPESTLPGYTYVLPKVADPDSPQYSVQAYELLTQTNKFELRTTEKPDGSQEVRLVLKSSLDRETTAEYNLEVVAWDGGQPPKSGTLYVRIIVSDTNDNNPTFDQETYEVTIPENVAPGYFVVGVHAVDLDSGLNSEIVYQFSVDTAVNLGHIFSINNKTGEITVKGKVDYEQASILYLTVEARDRGADPVPAEALVVIHVKDVNDHAPEILVHTLGGPGIQEATVLEGAAPGTFVARVVVTDKDSGDNGRYNCSLHEEHFVLDPLGSDFLITTSGALDREIRPEYSLAVSCQDFGQQPQTTITYIKVMIKDVNDNKPSFSKFTYFSEIKENNMPGAVLLKVNATDPDAGKNAEIVYSIQGPEAQRFTIDADTGVVKASISLDRERQSRHNIPLVATDKGDPALSGSATVIVDVLDDNDKGPVFTLSVYSFSVPENEDDDLEVGFVQAVDGDSDQFNKHTFSLQSGSESPFQISAETGRISTNRVLDREEHSVYSITVVAIDTSEPYYSSSATVSIYVMDRNDNPPRFAFPTPSNNTVYISNQVPLGQIITKVTAEDADIDRNGRVAYEIIYASQDDLFTIDRNTGAIVVGADLTNLDNRTFTLSIIASDNGPSPMSTSVTLHIVVNKTVPTAYQTDVDDVGPNVIILVSVACVSGILIVSLILAIVIMLRKQQHSHHKHQYETRMDATKVVNIADSQAVKVSQKREFSNLNGSAPTGDKPQDFMMELQGARDMKPQAPPAFPSTYSALANKCTKVDLSLEKSRQWLETLEQPAQTDIEISGRSKRSSTPPQRPTGSCPSGSAKIQSTGLQPLKSCLKNPLPGSVRKESGDSDSVNSAAPSNTDSGRGASEQEDIQPPRVIAYSPDGGPLPGAEKWSKLVQPGNKSYDAVKRPITGYPSVVSSPWQRSASQQHFNSPGSCSPNSPNMSDGRVREVEKNGIVLKSFGKTSTGHCREGFAPTLYGHSTNPAEYNVGNSYQSLQSKQTDVPRRHVYSPVDVGDKNGQSQRGNQHQQDEDDTSSVSGSYIINASAISRQSDEMFFNDVVV